MGSVVMCPAQTDTHANPGFATSCCISFESLKSPLDCKEIKPVNPKGNQS